MLQTSNLEPVQAERPAAVGTLCAILKLQPGPFWSMVIALGKVKSLELVTTSTQGTIRTVTVTVRDGQGGSQQLHDSRLMCARGSDRACNHDGRGVSRFVALKRCSKLRQCGLCQA
jgi:hypothetical protein